MLKVIRGIYKGKRLRRVSDPRVRPMPEKLKEALFHVLESEVGGAKVLDGFAGTGSVGIEALSRGAGHAVFVEEFKPAVNVIRHNLGRCGAEDRGEVVHQEFNRAVIHFGKDRARFNLIFLDPPYRLLDERDPLKVIWKRGVLEKGGVIILRRHRKTKFRPRYFAERRRLDLGDDTLVFYAAEGEGRDAAAREAGAGEAGARKAPGKAAARRTQSAALRMKRD